jgi:hypothetical protein
MAAASVSDLSNVLKTLYPPEYFQSVFFADNPFLGLVPKSERFFGNNKRISLQYAPSTGGSATFATAQANKGASSYEGFLLTRSKDYSLFSLETELIRAGSNNAGAVVQSLKAEVDGAMNTIKRSIGIWLFRNGGGARGQVGSTSTTTLTLKNRDEVFQFEKGMYLDTSATDGTSGSADGGQKQITDIDRSAGTLTAATNWTSASNFSDDDYIFREGDFGAVPTGLDGWLPSSVSATAFFGVDRTSDVERLGGVRYTGDAAKDQTIERTLIRASTEVDLMGGRPDYVIGNPLDVAILRKEIGAKEEHQKQVMAQNSRGPIANISYQYLTLYGANGPMKIIGDRNCPRGVMYMLTMSCWKLHTLGSCPGFLDDDGNRMLREASADALEGRIGLYGNLACDAPGYNARIDISSLPEVNADMN